MKRLLIIGGIVLGLTGCDSVSPVDLQAINTQHANNPEYVCTLPDGRKLDRIEIQISDVHLYSHYVYFMEQPTNTQTITVNHFETVGKIHLNQATIIIDGQSYTLVSKK